MVVRLPRGAIPAISDRSGLQFDRAAMVIEPGTGWLIHRDESDGQYNIITHPCNRINELIDFKPDPIPVDNPRPSTVDLILRDEDGNPITELDGDFLYSF